MLHVVLNTAKLGMHNKAWHLFEKLKPLTFCEGGKRFSKGFLSEVITKKAA